MTAAACGTGSAPTFTNTGEASEPAQRLKRRSRWVPGWCVQVLSASRQSNVGRLFFMCQSSGGEKDPLEQRDQSSASGPPSNGTKEHLGTA